MQTAGAAGIRDDDAELLKASEAAKGHALTLRILDLYLAKAHHGDVRRWQDIDFAAADREFQTRPDRLYGHAFAAIRATSSGSPTATTATAASSPYCACSACSTARRHRTACGRCCRRR
ncbi:hypothetical protein [Plasticicumulans sp.]|uniref:hypothetical protein n=1 Tax=Plasticicumulans sp. TaxID=2307179 RepID=UPI0039398D5C